MIGTCEFVLLVELESGGEKNGVPGRPASPVQTGPLPNGTSWQSCRKLIIVPRSAQKGYTVGHWPIPESFWPDVNNDTLVSGKLFCYFVIYVFCITVTVALDNLSFYGRSVVVIQLQRFFVSVLHVHSLEVMC